MPLQPSQTQPIRFFETLPNLRTLKRHECCALGASPHQLPFQITDLLAHCGIDLHSAMHHSTSMQDGAVITAAESFPDGVEGTLGHVASQVHGNLAWESDAFGAALAGHIGEAKIEMLGDLFLDLIDRDDLFRFLLQYIPQ